MNAAVLHVSKAKLLWEAAFPTGLSAVQSAPGLGAAAQCHPCDARAPWLASLNQLACATSHMASCCSPQFALVG